MLLKLKIQTAYDPTIPLLGMHMDKTIVHDSFMNYIGTSLVAQTAERRLQRGRPGFEPWVGKIPWRRKWQSTIAWKIPRTEDPGRLQSVGSQRVGHDWATSLHFTIVHKDTCNPVLKPTPFTIAWIRKQHKRPLTWADEEDVEHHTTVHHSATKQNKAMPPAATCVDPETVAPSEASERKRENMILPLCGLWKKWYKLTYLENRIESTD